jgi:hypothetical protein
MKVSVMVSEGELRVREKVSRILKRRGRGERARELGADFTLLVVPRRVTCS